MSEEKKELLVKATITFDNTISQFGYCDIDYGNIESNTVNASNVINNWKHEIRTVFDEFGVDVTENKEYVDYVAAAEGIMEAAADNLAYLTENFIKSIDRNINYDFETPANVTTITTGVKLYPRIDLELYKNSDTPASETENIRLEYKGYRCKIMGFDDGKYVGRIFTPNDTNYIEFEADSFNDLWKEFTQDVDYYITRQKLYNKYSSDMKATVEVDDGDK